ncbi:MAG: benzoate/H(+) symporter BenE family transporter [Pseudobdellovibrio sp.]
MKTLKQFHQDFSISAMVAGFIVTLVGMTSSAIVVFQAASSFGADAATSSSWLGSLCLGMGILTIYLSLKYKTPILMAWSTPGAALLIASSEGVVVSDLIGAFLFSSVLIIFSGLTGLFEKAMSRIPLGVASALLAGVLLNFTLNAFTSFNTQPLLIVCMFVTYIVTKKFIPNLSMLFVLLVGILTAAMIQQLHFQSVKVVATQFTFMAPTFSWITMIGIGFPLFVVTMASQNITGVTIMRSYGYTNPTSRILTKTGIVNFITSFFGGFTINLAAITAAIAMSPEAHPNKNQRYVAAVVSGMIYIIIGLMAGTVTSLFAAFPKELIAAIAGLALLGTVSSGLQKIFVEETEREAAFITFVIAASGLKFLNIVSAFWALVVGGLVLFFTKKK